MKKFLILFGVVGFLTASPARAEETKAPTRNVASSRHAKPVPFVAPVAVEAAPAAPEREKHERDFFADRHETLSKY